MTYVVLNPDGGFAYTDDCSVVMADSLEEARERREWVATEFMRNESSGGWKIARLDVTVVE